MSNIIWEKRVQDYSHLYNKRFLKPKRPWYYNHLYDKEFTGLVLKKMHYKKRIKMFGSSAVQAIIDEWKQLDEKNVLY